MPPPSISESRVRDLAGRGMKDNEIARTLGCGAMGVYKLRKRKNIPKGFQRKLTDESAVRELIAQGLTGPEIAAKFGLDREHVYRLCRQRGIQMAYPTGSKRPDRVGQRIVATKAEINARTPKAFGLPESLSPFKVSMLIALLDGPKTWLELRNSVTQKRSAHGGKIKPYIGELVRMGLMLSVKRFKERCGSRGTHRLPNLYSLTPKALHMLATAGKEQTK